VATQRLLIILLFACASLAGCGGSGGSSSSPPPQAPAPVPEPEPSGGLSRSAVCENGMAGDFPCSHVDLKARVPLDEMNGITGNDIWGWADPESGEEYALVGMTTGTAFVDVTDPQVPVFLGVLPAETVASAWRDIKVRDNHAYVVADGAGAHGMQVFDLTRLRDVETPTDFLPDFVYVDITNAHNIAVNESSGYLYAVGSNTCNGGLHMIDAAVAINPVFAGCYDPIYVHDTQCVNYIGPDVDHAGSEICVNSANDEDHEHEEGEPDESFTDSPARLDIADVTDKSSPVRLAVIEYPDSGYAHQGWMTEDQQFFLLGDELDERDLGLPTRTLVFDIRDLDAPVFMFAYEADTPSIGHNLYVLGNRVYEANYTSGLRVLEMGDLRQQELEEVAYFDTFPGSAAVDFSGAWSVYPYLPSGNLLVNDGSNGLFVLRIAP
jgi:choice-of-anchor B domain-containing protein